ncbi:MAG TPA: Nif11-like leader peptide family natural product precursor [Methylococcales bacterium]
MKADLKNFYQVLADEPTLAQQFELITDREEFLKLAVQIGSERGYTFSIYEVEASIKASTASEQGDYFCLPIGCWHKFQSA